MSVYSLADQLGLLSDRDIKPRLKEIDHSLKRIRGRAPLPPEEVDKYVHEINPEIQHTLLRRNELQPHHLGILMNHPDDEIANKALDHPHITTELLENQFNKLTNGRPYNELGAKSQDRVDAILTHPKASESLFNRMLQNKDDFVPTTHIHALIKRKSTSADTIRKVVHLKPEQVWDEVNEDVFREKAVRPSNDQRSSVQGRLWRNHRLTMYNNLVHHPNTPGDVFEHMFNDPYIKSDSQYKDFTVPAAMHPAATAAALHRIASLPNHFGQIQIGSVGMSSRFNRDYDNKPNYNKANSHVAVANHPNTSPETLRMLAKKKSNLPGFNRQLKLAILKNKNTPDDVKAKLREQTALKKPRFMR